jgi:hypothetical protein
MRTSVQFRIFYSIDNLFIQGQSFYIKSQNWGRELTTGEKERERESMRVQVWVGDVQSVSWKSRCLGKTHVYKKGKNASGDRLRLMRNLRKIDNDVSHEFDLQLFLTVRDISSGGQFDSYFPKLLF